MKNLFFKLNKGEISCDGQIRYEDDELLFVGEGEFRLRDRKVTAEQLAAYLKEKRELAEPDGLYSLIAYFKETGTLLAMQDAFSYCHPLYYRAAADGVTLALFLRDILAEGGERALATEYIPEFLYNGFLTDDRCLMRGVKKVPAMHALIGEGDPLTLRYRKRNYPIQAEAGDERDYYAIVEKSLRELLDGRNEVKMALSSGFDSNFLLDSVKRIYPEKAITAFTIGGSKGQDETESVKKICFYHPDVELKIAQVTPKILQSLPQIVSELEDSVFERGIFLQYVMGKTLVENRVDRILLGEGADQVLSSEFKTTADPYYFVGMENHYPWVYYPYEMLTYIILKKNGIFLRNRDIVPLYPFLRHEYIRGVSDYRAANGTSKNHYKAYVAARVGEEVGAILIKRPGSTNLSSLIDEHNETLLEQARASCFYSLLPPQPDRDSGSEVELDNCLKVLFLMVFEKVFCGGEEDVARASSLSLDEVLGVRKS